MARGRGHLPLNNKTFMLFDVLGYLGRSNLHGNCGRAYFSWAPRPLDGSNTQNGALTFANDCIIMRTQAAHNALSTSADHDHGQCCATWRHELQSARPFPCGEALR